MNFREAAETLKCNNPLFTVLPEFREKRKEAEKIAIELLIREARKMETAEDAKYRDI